MSLHESAARRTRQPWRALMTTLRRRTKITTSGTLVIPAVIEYVAVSAVSRLKLNWVIAIEPGGHIRRVTSLAKELRPVANGTSTGWPELGDAHLALSLIETGTCI